MKDRLGVETHLEKGAGGQFDVLVDGTVVAQRTGGFWKKITGGGWPNEEAVIQLLQQQSPSHAG
ncbi:Rdx family protein [bacterium AH-315-F18]|nr:Rdx family protein [bacterium AH-315-F18]